MKEKKEFKLNIVAADYGYEHYEHMFNDYSSLDPSVPGVCMSDNCNHIQDIPPARQDDFCEECEKQTVVSVLVLGGLVQPNE